MKSVDRLVKEHDLIERGLSLLEKSVALTESGQPVPDDFRKWAPDFFSQFADKCHHAKEEDLFFPLLKERGTVYEAVIENQRAQTMKKRRKVTANRPQRYQPLSAVHLPARQATVGEIVWS